MIKEGERERERERERQLKQYIFVSFIIYSGTDRSLIQVEMGSIFPPGNEGYSKNRDNTLANKYF